MLKQIEDFARALAQATYDCSIERDAKIRHYYDADIILPVIFGLRFQLRDRDAELICALLSAGFMGRAHLLRPHALEVSNYVRHQASRESPAEQAYYRTLATDYFERNGVLDRVRALREALQAETDPHTRAERAIAALRESGTDMFVALELTRGDWRQRLLRFHGAVLRFTDDATDVPGVLEHPVLPRILDALARFRPQSTYNNFMDAVAMTTLHLQVASPRADREQVRFHTHTFMLTRALREAAVSRHFSYGVNDRTPDPWECRNALRSNSYSLVRASFDALHFPGVRRGIHRPPAVTLEELERVAEELTDALHANDKAAVRKASRVSIGGVALQTVLEDLRRFSFLDSVLRHYEVPAIDALVDDLDEIFSTARTDAARQAIHARIRADADRLMLHLAVEVDTMRDTVALISAVSHMLSDTGSAAEYRVSDPLRDVGMARWGFDEASLDAEFAQTLLIRLLSPDAGPDVLRACAELAAAEREPRTYARCAAVCTVLQVLGLHQRVVIAITKLEQSAGDVPIPLHCLRLASRLFARDNVSSGELLLQLEALETHARKQTPDTRAKALLGIASVLMLAVRTSATKPNLEWLERSVHLAEYALDDVPPHSLQSLFLVDHCVHAGLDAGLPEERVTLAVDALHSARASRWWHYRFANTLAYAWLDPVRRALTGKSELGSDRACFLLAMAYEILHVPIPRYRDVEGRYLAEVVGELQVQFGCRRAIGHASHT